MLWQHKSGNTHIANSARHKHPKNVFHLKYIIYISYLQLRENTPLFIVHSLSHYKTTEVVQSLIWVNQEKKLCLWCFIFIYYIQVCSLLHIDLKKTTCGWNIISPPFCLFSSGYTNDHELNAWHCAHTQFVLTIYIRAGRNSNSIFEAWYTVCIYYQTCHHSAHTHCSLSALGSVMFYWLNATACTVMYFTRQ